MGYCLSFIVLCSIFVHAKGVQSEKAHTAPELPETSGLKLIPYLWNLSLFIWHWWVTLSLQLGFAWHWHMNNWHLNNISNIWQNQPQVFLFVFFVFFFAFSLQAFHILNPFSLFFCFFKLHSFCLDFIQVFPTWPLTRLWWTLSFKDFGGGDDG